MLADASAFISRGFTVALFGTPVTIRVIYVLFMGLLAISVRPFLPLAVEWLLVATLCIVVHEFGHVLVARRYGYRSRIELAGLGGMAIREGGGYTTWRESLLISLAGPGLGFVLGAIAWLAILVLAPLPSPLAIVVGDILGLSVAWSLFSLLPILPLDGGQALQGLLSGVGVAAPGRVIRIVSVVAAVIAGALAILAGQTWIALLLGLLGYQSYAELRGLPPLNFFGR